MRSSVNPHAITRHHAAFTFNYSQITELIAHGRYIHVLAIRETRATHLKREVSLAFGQLLLCYLLHQLGDPVAFHTREHTKCMWQSGAYSTSMRSSSLDLGMKKE